MADYYTICSSFVPEAVALSLVRGVISSVYPVRLDDASVRCEVFGDGGLPIVLVGRTGPVLSFLLG